MGGIVFTAIGGIRRFGTRVYSCIRDATTLVSGIFFRRQQGGENIEVADAQQAQIADFQRNIQPVNKKWRKIEITQEDRRVLKKLQSQDFLKKVQLYKCSLSRGNQIMVKPAGMKCCLSKYLAEEKVLLGKMIKNPNKCQMCGAAATVDDIIRDGRLIEITEDGIQQFRKRVKITFDLLNPDLKIFFKEQVEDSFGKGYCEEHLAN